MAYRSNRSYPEAPRSRVRIPAAEKHSASASRPSLADLRRMIREHESEAYPWDSDMRPNKGRSGGGAYRAISRKAKDLGLPLKYETDLLVRDRDFLEENDGVDVFWAIGEMGTFIAAPSEYWRRQNLRGVLQTLSEEYPHWFFVSTDGSIEAVDEPSEVTAFLTQRPEELTMNARSEADEAAATELVLYIENDSKLWGPNSQGASIRKNIAQKIENGTFDPDKLPKMFEYLTESGAKAYAKDFDRPSNWNKLFTAATRRLAAESMAETYLDELRVQGEYSPNGKGKGYNGYPSWNAWNVSLWINNDQGLYETAKDCVREARTRDKAAEMFLDILVENVGKNPKTPDGAPFTVSSIKLAMRDL